MKNSKNSSQGFSQYVDINLKYILTLILTISHLVRPGHESLENTRIQASPSQLLATLILVWPGIYIVAWKSSNTLVVHKNTQK